MVFYLTINAQPYYNEVDQFKEQRETLVANEYKIGLRCANCAAVTNEKVPYGVRFTESAETETEVLPSGYLHPSDTEWDGAAEVPKFVELACLTCGLPDLIRRENGVN